MFEHATLFYIKVNLVGSESYATHTSEDFGKDLEKTLGKLSAHILLNI